MGRMVELPHGSLNSRTMRKGSNLEIQLMNLFNAIFPFSRVFLFVSPKFMASPIEYPDTAVINICSNIEYGPSLPILYTSSTHLNITGHRFDDDSSEIFSKYSTLPIGMFALRVCPHDPNKYVLFYVSLFKIQKLILNVYKK